MELKKNPKADLKNWRGIFLEGGLVIALLACIIAFGISQKEKIVEIQDFGRNAADEELIDITQEKEKPKIEPMKQTVAVIADAIKIVKNDTKLNTDFIFSEPDEPIDMAPIETGPEVIDDDNTVFVIIEDMPTFQGGDVEKFKAWVNKNFVYPQAAADNGIQGSVVVEFIVEKDGKIRNVDIKRSPDRLLSDETKRIILKSPTWTPGRNRNMPARVGYTLELVYRLGN